MSSMGKRLQLAREHAGYPSGRQAALSLGWTYPTYAAHESGWRNYPTKVAKKYSKAFGVSEEWLLFGKSPPDWYSLDAPGEMTEVRVPVRYMPLFDTNNVASDIEDQLRVGADRKDYAVVDQGIPAGCFAVRVSSDELEGGTHPIKKGDILIFEPRKEPNSVGAIVILNVRRQTRPSLRKAKSGSGARFRYAAFNENYDDLDEHDGKVFGRAVLHIRKM
jgi:hypothetical protein